MTPADPWVGPQEMGRDRLRTADGPSAGGCIACVHVAPQALVHVP